MTWVNPAVAAEITELKLLLDDGPVLHTGSDLPSAGAIAIDTMELADGKHTLTLAGIHRRHGYFEHRWDFQVRNRWTLVQHMNPPRQVGGWWADQEIDYLQTAQRSAGWTYDTDRDAEFFGDRERLIKATDDEEFPDLGDSASHRGNGNSVLQAPSGDRKSTETACLFIGR